MGRMGTVGVSVSRKLQFTGFLECIGKLVETMAKRSLYVGT